MGEENNNENNITLDEALVLITDLQEQITTYKNSISELQDTVRSVQDSNQKLFLKLTSGVSNAGKNNNVEEEPEQEKTLDEIILENKLF